MASFFIVTLASFYIGIDSAERIRLNWDDMLRVAASLKTGRVRGSEVIAMVGGEKPSTLGKAIMEVGRIAKTYYLLDLINDETYQRRILIQLNRGEARQSLARNVFHGRKGELRQPYREGMEEQLGVLGLVVNMIVLWNTLYLERSVADIRARGIPVVTEDLERLSPLGSEHIAFGGNYPFVIAEYIRQGAYLPLRTVEDQEIPSA